MLRLWRFRSAHPARIAAPRQLVSGGAGRQELHRQNRFNRALTFMLLKSHLASHLAITWRKGEPRLHEVARGAVACKLLCLDTKFAELREASTCM